MPWTYYKSEPMLYTVAFVDEHQPSYNQTDSDWPTQKEAADRVAYLNGGTKTDPALLEVLSRLKQLDALTKQVAELHERLGEKKVLPAVDHPQYESIELRGGINEQIIVDLTYSYDPGEKGNLTGHPDSRHPAAPEEFEFIEFAVDGFSLYANGAEALHDMILEELGGEEGIIQSIKESWDEL